MVLILTTILTSGDSAGGSVAKGLERLNTSAVCADETTDIGEIAQYGCVYISGDFALSSPARTEFAKSLFGICEAAEIPTIFDPTPSALPPESVKQINELAKLCEIFVPSDEDLMSLFGSCDPEKAAEHYLSLGTKKIVITLDKKGAYFKSAKESGYAPTFRADMVVDTTGAGIAFKAGLITGVIEDMPLAEAVVRANACGCISIQKQGEYCPDASELREYMLSHRFAVDGCKDF